MWITAIPKRHTIFRLEVPWPDASVPEGGEYQNEAEDQNDNTSTKPLVFELFGSQIENRAPDRATKKFKTKNMLDL